MPKVAPEAVPETRGAVPGHLQAAGFASVAAVGRRAGLLTFWMARKPGPDA